MKCSIENYNDRLEKSAAEKLSVVVFVFFISIFVLFSYFVDLSFYEYYDESRTIHYGSGVEVETDSSLSSFGFFAIFSSIMLSYRFYLKSMKKRIGLYIKTRSILQWNLWFYGFMSLDFFEYLITNIFEIEGLLRNLALGSRLIIPIALFFLVWQKKGWLYRCIDEATCGNFREQYFLGEIYLEGGTYLKKDSKKAKYWLDKALNNKDCSKDIKDLIKELQ